MIYDNKTFEFKGIPSGDGESFCWDVDKETFIKIKGIEPEVSDQSFYNNELYMIYPMIYILIQGLKILIM